MKPSNPFRGLSLRPKVMSRLRAQYQPSRQGQSLRVQPLRNLKPSVRSPQSRSASQGVRGAAQPGRAVRVEPEPVERPGGAPVAQPGGSAKERLGQPGGRPGHKPAEHAAPEPGQYKPGTGTLSPDQLEAVKRRILERHAAKHPELLHQPEIGGQAPHLDPELLTPLHQLGRHVLSEHPKSEYEPWAQKMLEHVPGIDEPHLRHTWAMLQPDEEENRGEPRSKTEAREGDREHGVRSVPDERDAGGRHDRRGAPRKRRIIVARPEHTKQVSVERTPADLRQHLGDDALQAAEKAIQSMEQHGGFLLASGAGVGKTRVIYTVSRHFLAKNPVLIVAPAEALKLKGSRPTGSYADDVSLLGIQTKLWKPGMPSTQRLARSTQGRHLFSSRLGTAGCRLDHRLGN